MPKTFPVSSVVNQFRLCDWLKERISRQKAVNNDGPVVFFFRSLSMSDNKHMVDFEFKLAWALVVTFVAAAVVLLSRVLLLTTSQFIQ